MCGRHGGGPGGLCGGGFSQRRDDTLGEVGGEEAEWLALVGGQGGTVALEVAWDAAAGGTRTVAEGLNTALPLQLCREGDTDRERERETVTQNNKLDDCIQYSLTPYFFTHDLTIRTD